METDSIYTDFLPQIDLDLCISCDLCIRICPNQVLDMVDNQPIVAKPDACTYSGLCEENCPTQAISLPFEIIF